MVWPLWTLAVGAIVAGFIGIPAALWGTNELERFLEPSFVARRAVSAHLEGSGTSPSARPEAAPKAPDTAADTLRSSPQAGSTPPPPAEVEPPVEIPPVAGAEAGQVGPPLPEERPPGQPEPSSQQAVSGDDHAEPVSAAGAAAEHVGAEHLSWIGEIGLMLFSTAVAALGIALAYQFYVAHPGISEALARRLAIPHRMLANKYYIDELYNATFVRGTLASAVGLWMFDTRVVDGAVNGTGWLTRLSAWLSHMADKYLVDGFVNSLATVAQESSYLFRRLQTGLIQNYALLMLFGVFAFVSLYLFAR